jgi:hypothetical protein
MAHRILYVIREVTHGWHKIGITNDWHRRQRELEVGGKTEAVHVVRVNDARQIERFLHRRFKAQRLPQSEWFNLDQDQLAFVRSTVLKARSDFQGDTPTEPEQSIVPAASTRKAESAPPQSSASSQAQQSRPASPAQNEWVRSRVEEGSDAVAAIAFAAVAFSILLIGGYHAARAFTCSPQGMRWSALHQAEQEREGQLLRSVADVEADLRMFPDLRSQLLSQIPVYSEDRGLRGDRYLTGHRKWCGVPPAPATPPPGPSRRLF